MGKFRLTNSKAILLIMYERFLSVKYFIFAASSNLSTDKS